MPDDKDSEINPWTRLSTRLVYENAWIRVSEDQVLKPNGEPGIYGRVGFHNLAVGILPVDERGYTWLVGQYRYLLDRYSWEIPMGGQPRGEDPIAGARRELEEETGLSAARFDELLRVELSNSVTDEEGVVYLARDLTRGQPSPDDTEELRLLHLPLEEAIAMAMDGRIRDLLSVAGLQAVALRRRELGL